MTSPKRLNVKGKGESWVNNPLNQNRSDFWSFQKSNLEYAIMLLVDIYSFVDIRRLRFS